MDKQRANASLVIAIPVVLIAVWGTFVTGPAFVQWVQSMGSYQSVWAYQVASGTSLYVFGVIPFQIAVVPFLQFLAGFMAAGVVVGYYADTVPKWLVAVAFILAIIFLCFYIAFFVMAGSGDVDMSSMALRFTYFSDGVPPVCLFLTGACFAAARYYL